jgi:hypothetical protein
VQRKIFSDRPSEANKILCTRTIDELRRRRHWQPLHEAAPEDKWVPPILRFTPKANATKLFMASEQLPIARRGERRSRTPAKKAVRRAFSRYIFKDRKGEAAAEPCAARATKRRLL